MIFFRKAPIDHPTLTSVREGYEKERSATTAYDNLILREINEGARHLKKSREDTFVLEQVCYDGLRMGDKTAINGLGVSCHVGGILKALKGRIIKDVVWENIRGADNPTNSKGQLRVILEPMPKPDEPTP